MKLNQILTSISLAFSLGVSSVLASDPSGIALPGPAGITADFFYLRKAGPAQGVPVMVTNAAQVILTNVVVEIQRDQPVLIEIYGASAAGAGSNNIVAYGDVSNDGGVTYTTTRPYSSTITPVPVSAGSRLPFYVPFTNMLGGTHFRLTAVSNTIPAASAAAAYFITNVTATTRRAPPSLK
jgi:hypothetical protein